MTSVETFVIKGLQATKLLFANDFRNLSKERILTQPHKNTFANMQLFNVLLYTAFNFFFKFQQLKY